MFHAVALFRALGIVEAIRGAHKVARDASDALEPYSFAYVNFSIPLRPGMVRYYFRHCSAYRISMNAFMKAVACGATRALP